jgi:hypothetical protein
VAAVPVEQILIITPRSAGRRAGFPEQRPQGRCTPPAFRSSADHDPARRPWPGEHLASRGQAIDCAGGRQLRALRRGLRLSCLNGGGASMSRSPGPWRPALATTCNSRGPAGRPRHRPRHPQPPAPASPIAPGMRGMARRPGTSSPPCCRCSTGSRVPKHPHTLIARGNLAYWSKRASQATGK